MLSFVCIHLGLDDIRSSPIRRITIVPLFFLLDHFEPTSWLEAKLHRWQPGQVEAILRRGQHEEPAALVAHFGFAEGHGHALLDPRGGRHPPTEARHPRGHQAFAHGAGAKATKTHGTLDAGGDPGA